MATRSRARVPGSVTFLGVLWLLAAAGALTWGMGLIFVFGVVDRFTAGGLSGMPGAPSAARPLQWMFHHYLVSGLALFALSSAALVAGVRFLRLESWARWALEVGGWFAFVLSLAIGLWPSHFWEKTWSSVEVGSLFSSLAEVTLCGVLPAVFVLLLRSRPVIAAFRTEESAAQKLI
jgi:hypothetical protein